MTWIIPWNGKDYDVDPAEFSAGELKLIKERTGLTYMKLVTAAVTDLDGEAIAAMFWIVDRRSNPDLKFSDYDGPPLKLILINLDGYNTASEELGKAMGLPETPKVNPATLTTLTDGGSSSPSSTPLSSTEPSTTA